MAQPRLFLAGERGAETVSIHPVGEVRAQAAGPSFQLVLPGVTVRVEGGGDARQQGAAAGRAFMDQLLYEVRHGQLGHEIDKRARRARP